MSQPAPKVHEQLLENFRQSIGNDADDDELIFEGATETFICPLTQQRFSDPFTSCKCKHSFSKEAIYEMLRGRFEVQCPVAGCAHKIRKEDLYSDKRLVIRAQRSQQIREQIEYDELQ